MILAYWALLPALLSYLPASLNEVWVVVVNGTSGARTSQEFERAPIGHTTKVRWLAASVRKPSMCACETRIASRRVITLFVAKWLL